jgi:hypothetical protein
MLHVKLVVFLGPTLPHAEAADRLAGTDAVILPPAAQGDVLRAVQQLRPRIIGLIDGAFLNTRAVWHREILFAMTEGVHMFGAASMGALRAAELDAFGMRGIGAIYEAYRTGMWPGLDQAFEDDDEVAVIHAPPEAGCAPLSDSMADIRATLLAAEAAGIIGEQQHAEIAAAMKALHFSQRSFARLAGLGDAGFAAWLKTSAVSQKKRDALALIDAAISLAAEDPPPFQAQFRMERALVWESVLHAAGAQPGDVGQMVLEELRLDPPRWRSVAQAVLGRLHGPEAALSDSEFATLLGQFREQRGLWRREDLDTWMAENAAGWPDLRRLLRQETAVAVALKQERARMDTAILDQLRAGSEFAPLLRRAQAKAQAAGEHDKLPGAPVLDAAIDWWFDQRARTPRPRALADYARGLGWPDEKSFESAIWRERQFVLRQGSGAP